MNKSGLTYGLASLELFFCGPTLYLSLSAGLKETMRAEGGPQGCLSCQSRFLIGFGLASPRISEWPGRTFWRSLG